MRKERCEPPPEFTNPARFQQQEIDRFYTRYGVSLHQFYGFVELALKNFHPPWMLEVDCEYFKYGVHV